jgi:photosystem II stability/assembly factor-like uncharacterized protein
MRRFLIAFPALLCLAAPSRAAWELTYKKKLTDLHAIGEQKGLIFTGSDDGVLISKDQGATWDFGKPGLSSIAWEFETLGDTLFAATKDKGVQISLDGGQSWKGAGGAGGQSDIRGMVKYQGALYIGSNGGGAFRSRDAGRTWQAINTGLGGMAVNAVTAGGGYVFAATAKNGIFRSSDQGDHWQAANNNFNGPGAFFLAFDGKVLYAVPIDHKGVIHSDDLGSTWITDITGQGTLPYPHSLEAYGTNVFFINAQDGGVQLTKDGCKTIIHVNQPKSPIQPRYIGLAGGYLFVMDFQNGIWRKPIAELDLAPIPTGALPARERVAPTLPWEARLLDGRAVNAARPSSAIFRRRAIR